MPPFERVLATHLAMLAVAGCGGTNEEAPVSCDDPYADLGAASTGDHVLSSGFVVVDDGEPCPDAADVSALGHVTCCPWAHFDGLVCGYITRHEDMVSDLFGMWVSAPTPDDSGFTSAREPKDLCEYSGAFVLTGECCGRPLLAEGSPVVARVASHPAWSMGARAEVDALAPEVARRVAEHWLRSALLEHASVASFARFTLDLLRFGAPPDLVRDAQRAGLDEVEHARLCFALAASALGSEVGPGAMDLEGIGLSADLRSFAEAVVREGCVGETLAAVDAAVRLQGATDPGVREALTRIVADESRHAALAWATVRWLLDAHPELATHLAGVFADEAARASWTGESASGEGRSHGLLTTSARRRAIHDAFARVVGPAWEALHRGNTAPAAT